nr:hypothetical protein [Tanacetum cinerariifolium]
MEDLKQKYLDELKCLSNLEYRDEIKIAELTKNFNEISSGSFTTHYDISLSEYDSFIFDLTHEEFVDELAHIISPPEYDRLCFWNLLDPGITINHFYSFKPGLSHRKKGGKPAISTRGGKSFAAIELGIGSTCPVPTSQGTPVDVSDPDPLYFADPESHPSANVTQELLRPEIRNQRIHRLPPWSGLLKAYIGLNGARENEIKNLETLLEVKTDMKKAAKNKSVELSKELDNMRALFSDLQHCAEMDACLDALSIDFDEKLYLHMLTAIAGCRWVIRRGLCLAVKKYDESTELRQAFVDVVLAGIAKGMCEGLKHGVEHEKVKLDLEAIEAYDPKAKAKYIAALHALKNLKYPLVDQLEKLKDAPMDVIMTYLHLESDTGDDDPQWIHELYHSSSQLTIPVYLEACDPMDPWACKEEILLADAIAANVSHAKKKKKCRVVCRVHGVGSTHHARSDGVPVFVPTGTPQGLAILLADTATQTEISEDEASPRLLR